MSFFSALLRRKRPARFAETPGEAVYRALAEQASDILIHVGPNGLATYVSPSVRILLGYEPEQVIGTDTLWLVAPQDRQELAASVAQLHMGEIPQLRRQVRLLRSDGTEVWADGNAATASDGTSTVLILRDITDQKRVEEELTALALQDALTGLANRRSFDQTLNRAWLRTLSEMSELSLLLLDLDRFKQFNDAYGHQAGDDCLRSVAAATRSALTRPGDVACRYGGEELAVILMETGLERATAVAEQIRHAIEALQITHIGNPGASIVTVSIGVATALARAGGTIRMPEGLLSAADHALYRAKTEGRNRCATSLLFAPHT